MPCSADSKRAPPTVASPVLRLIVHDHSRFMSKTRLDQTHSGRVVSDCRSVPLGEMSQSSRFSQPGSSDRPAYASGSSAHVQSPVWSMILARHRFAADVRLTIASQTHPRVRAHHSRQGDRRFAPTRRERLHRHRSTVIRAMPRGDVRRARSPGGSPESSSGRSAPNSSSTAGRGVRAAQWSPRPTLRSRAQACPRSPLQ